MKQYILHCNNKVTYELVIGNEQDRFNGEGVLQNVTLYRIDNDLIFPKEEVYETTYGWFTAIEHFNNIDINEFEEDNINFDEFKNWIITSLTPITEQRKVKIGRIKEKI